MDYENKTREELIELIHNLTVENHELINKIEEVKDWLNTLSKDAFQQVRILG